MRARINSLLRSLCVQGAWNYRGMQHLGLLWSQLPLLPEDPEQRKAALRRAFEFYNGHPYLCGYLLGAAETLEKEGKGEMLSRLKRAAIAPIGASGDRIFWTGLKPLFGALACITLLPLAISPDASLWLLVLPVVLLLAYNVIHVTRRSRALRDGASLGLAVHSAIRELGEGRMARRLPTVLAFVAGLGAPLLLISAEGAGGMEWERLVVMTVLLVISWQLPRARWALPALLLLVGCIWSLI